MARGDGATTRQMQAAPQGALFVWVNHRLGYPKDLARKLGRADLEIVPPSYLEGDQFRGRTFSGIVIDHAATLTNSQWDGHELFRERIRPTSTGASKA